MMVLGHSSATSCCLPSAAHLSESSHRHSFHSPIATGDAVCGLTGRCSKTLALGLQSYVPGRRIQTKSVGDGSRRQRRRRRWPFVTRKEDGVSPAMASQAALQEVAGAEGVKERLLIAVEGLDRGAGASKEDRAIVQELMVELEGMTAPGPVDLDLLRGDWKLIYTTASDVTSILKGNEFPLFKVGYIGQSFIWDADRAEGVVENVVKWSIAVVLESEGATLRVKAKYNAVAPRTIALSFEQAEVGDVRISDALQGLIAPALFDRGMFPLMVLQQLKSLNVKVPLQSRGPSPSSPERAGAGLRYFLSYLDDSFLLGRSVGGGGVFIFSRQR